MTATIAPPTLAFTAAPLTDGVPTEDTESFRLQLDQAVSGGAGTAAYLGHVQKLAGFSAYLKKAGDAAFTVGPGRQRAGHRHRRDHHHDGRGRARPADRRGR